MRVPISIFPRVCYRPVMRIVQIPLLRDNYGYLAVCEETGETAVIDPSEADPVLERIDKEKVDATAILNTHHHRDHRGSLATSDHLQPGGDRLPHVPNHL